EITRLMDSIHSNLKDSRVRAQIHIWDNSPSETDLSYIEPLREIAELFVTHDPDNCGFAMGHNHLMAASFDNQCDYYLGLNPDGYLLRNALERALCFVSNKDHETLVELNTHPLPHPKWYHPVTGETEWVSGCAFMLSRGAYTTLA